jgi:hypothetical protein
MIITIPPKWRVVIYLAIVLITPLVGYLRVKGFIGDQELALWGSYVSVGGTIATLNVTKPVQ